MIYPLLPIFLSSVLGAGGAFIGLIEGIAEGTASVLKGFSGYLSDKLKKRKALIFAGYGLSTVTKPVFAVATQGWHVLIIRFLERVGKGLRTAPRDAMIADDSGSDTRGRAYGFHRAMDTLGAAIGPALAALLMWILKDLGNARYRWVFLAAFFPALLAMILIVFFLEEKPFSAVGKFPGFRLSGFPRSYKMLLLVVVVFTLGNSSDAFLLLKAGDVFKNAGIKSSTIPILVPLVWLTFNIVYSAVSMPGGILSDKIGRRKTVLIAFTFYGLIYIGFAFAESILAVWLLMSAYGVFYGLSEGVLRAYVADMAPAQMKGMAFGIYHAVDGVSRLLASVIFGVIWQLVSPIAAFLFGACLALVASLMLWTLCEEAPRMTPAS